MTIQLLDPQEIPAIKGRGRKPPASDFEVAEVLRANPGKVAVLPLNGRQAKGMQIVINQLGNQAFPVGEFYATLRENTVYVELAG